MKLKITKKEAEDLILAQFFPPTSIRLMGEPVLEIEWVEESTNILKKLDEISRPITEARHAHPVWTATWMTSKNVKVKLERMGESPTLYTAEFLAGDKIEKTNVTVDANGYIKELDLKLMKNLSTSASHAEGK